MSGNEAKRPQAKPALASYKRRLPHLQLPGIPIFVTFNTHKRWVLPPNARSLAMKSILYDHPIKYSLHAAVVMPDHAHLLLTPNSDDEGNTFGFTQIMQAIKSASAHAINRQLGRAGRVWQEESFDRLLRSDEKLREKAEYICANPIRAGLAGMQRACFSHPRQRWFPPNSWQNRRSFAR